MKQYIDKAKVVAEIERKKAYAQTLGDNAINSSMQQFYDGMREGCNNLLSFINTLEVKKFDMPVLDNRKMSVERWKEACKAASCQANYRKSKGLTETCDDYFVDGVQWADEHSIKMKEVDLEKEIELVKGDYEQVDVAWNNDFDFIAKHFFELGIKSEERRINYESKKKKFK